MKCNVQYRAFGHRRTLGFLSLTNRAHLLLAWEWGSVSEIEVGSLTHFISFSICGFILTLSSAHFSILQQTYKIYQCLTLTPKTILVEKDLDLRSKHKKNGGSEKLKPRKKKRHLDRFKREGRISKSSSSLNLPRFCAVGPVTSISHLNPPCLPNILDCQGICAVRLVFREKGWWNRLSIFLKTNVWDKYCLL